MNEEPKPKKLDPRTELLRRLYQTIGQVIQLDSAKASKKLVILDDLEIIFPDDLKERIAERVKTKLSKAASLIKEIQDDGE